MLHLLTNRAEGMEGEREGWKGEGICQDMSTSTRTGQPCWAMSQPGPATGSQAVIHVSAATFRGTPEIPKGLEHDSGSSPCPASYPT